MNNMTPKPGDYIATNNLSDEDYHAMALAVTASVKYDGEREESVEDGYLPVPTPKQCAEDLRDDGFHPQASCVDRMIDALEWIACNACQSSRLECQKRAIRALSTER